jgi:hypothetical protein
MMNREEGGGPLRYSRLRHLPHDSGLRRKDRLLRGKRRGSRMIGLKDRIMLRKLTTEYAELHGEDRSCNKNSAKLCVLRGYSSSELSDV